MTSVRVVVLAGLLPVLAVLLHGPAATAQQAGTARAFVGARLFDGTGRLIEKATLIVRDGRVERVDPDGSGTLPAGVERIDVTGRTIIPGLINAHGHVGETQGLQSGLEFYTRENVLDQLRLYARYGVTTVFSLGGDREPGFRVRDEQETPALDRARLYVAGPALSPGNPEHARLMVNALADMGTDWIKIRVDDNLGATQKMPLPIAELIIRQAHQRKRPVAAHIFYLEDAKALLRAGADLIAHSIRDQEVDQEVVDLLKERQVCVCPTLTRELSTFVYGSRPEFFDDPFFRQEAEAGVLKALQDPERQETVRTSRAAQEYRKAFEVASRNLVKLWNAEVGIAFGTDSGPPARFQGYFEHLELTLMVEAGLTPAQTLLSATGQAARCMKVADRIGTLQPGRWADFIVLEKNPLEDIRHTRTIESVWIAGQKVPARN
jgi:imidazolonepropionase-like amidohydrolase